MRKLILILLLMCVIITLPHIGRAKNLEDVLIKRASFLSDLQTKWDKDLDYPRDKPTTSQIYNRINSIIKYSKLYNDLDPELYWEDVAIDVFAIMAHETGFINYLGLNGGNLLDKGESFGTGSMQWKTAEHLLKELPQEYNKWKLQSNTSFQIKLVVYNYYQKYNHFGDRKLAIVSYNQGYSVSTNTQRYERYFFQVNGRVHYIKNNLL